MNVDSTIFEQVRLIPLKGVTLERDMNAVQLIRAANKLNRYTQSELPPNAITRQIQAFAATFGELVWVDYCPDAKATQGLCYANVAARAAAEGGATVYGWKLRENPHYISAEWHAVWRKLDGSLVDITPDSDKPERTLFVIDPTFTELPNPIPKNRNRAKTIAGARTLKKLAKIGIGTMVDAVGQRFASINGEFYIPLGE